MGKRKGNPWIDISVGLHPGTVHWPGDQDLALARVQRMEDGAVANVSALAMNAHTGTHMDAPYHFVKGGVTLDQLPLEAVLGRARVIEVKDPVAITPEALRAHRLRRGERILIKTGNSARCWREPHFVEDFIYIAQAAARYLVECGVRTVGVDYLSVGGFRVDAVETHQILLGGGIWVIEGLDLSAVAPGSYRLVCLPLKLIGTDGAPARAALRRRDQQG